MPAPVAGAGCLTCEHPEVDEINALINAGGLSSRKIAARFGLQKDTIARHAWKRHPGIEVPEDGSPPGGVAGGAGEPDDGRSELDRLREIRVRLETELHRTGRSDTSRELRQVNGRIASLTGADRPREVTVDDVQGLAEQVRRWFEALEPFPDAREAMLAATDPLLLEASDVPAE